MGLFGSSFEDKVNAAVQQVSQRHPEVRNLDARIDGKTVTLTGEAPDLAAKTTVMQAFNALVEADNVVNQIRLVQSPAAKFGLPGPAEAMPAGAAPSAQGTIHEVVKGDTLSGLAKRYLGNGNLYMKIFEANRDQLKDPNLIKIGQKLRIPK